MRSVYSSRGMTKNHAGFCVIFNNCINVCKLHQEKFNNSDVLVDVPEINNLFNLRNIKDLPYTYDIESVFVDLVVKGLYDNSSNAHVICDSDKLIAKNKIYNEFFELKNIEDYEKEALKFIDDKTLAIQLRGTDKHNEVTPPSVEQIESHIKQMLSNNTINSIFLSTDDIVYQNLLIEKFGDIVKYRDKDISMNGNPLHFIDDRTELNKDLMMDIYLLSKSKYFLYSFSNVSYLALTIGINNFEKIKCLNEAV